MAPYTCCIHVHMYCSPLKRLQHSRVASARLTCVAYARGHLSALSNGERSRSSDADQYPINRVWHIVASGGRCGQASPSEVWDGRSAKGCSSHGSCPIDEAPRGHSTFTCCSPAGAIACRTVRVGGAPRHKPLADGQHRRVGPACAATRVRVSCTMMLRPQGFRATAGPLFYVVLRNAWSGALG